MYFYAKQVKLILCILLSAFFFGCYSPVSDRLAAGTLDDCDVGKTCRVKGKLEIYQGTTFVGVLEIEDSCVALALPREIYSASDDWSGNQVIVSGTLHTYGYASAVISIFINDRPMATGMCSSEFAIYVDEITVI